MLFKKKIYVIAVMIAIITGIFLVNNQKLKIEEKNVTKIEEKKTVKNSNQNTTEKASSDKEKDEMLAELKNYDFSKFAGEYTADSDDISNYSLENTKIKINEDGTISGGESFFDKNKPIDVIKLDDGSYKCILKDNAYNDNSYYIIYPEGIIEDNDYIKENKPFIKDIVYIKYFQCDGGILEARYYSDDIEKEVEYADEDWVNQESLKEGIGETFVSGTNKEYEVIDIEYNDDAGRYRIVLLSKDNGKKMVINNMPNFKVDSKSQVIYFDISKYEKDSNYSSSNN